jgi:hypothetical protein
MPLSFAFKKKIDDGVQIRLRGHRDRDQPALLFEWGPEIQEPCDQVLLF